jgi:HSP20 family protein
MVQSRNLSPFEEFSSDMERLLDSLVGRTVGTVMRSNNAERFVPTLDVSETADAFWVSVDLPGVKPDDVKVELHEGRLSISGSRQSRSEDQEKNYHRIERSSGSFVRTLALPSEVNSEEIDAQYTDGVLHVKLPKVAKQQPKKIQIRTAGNGSEGDATS